MKEENQFEDVYNKLHQEFINDLFLNHWEDAVKVVVTNEKKEKNTYHNGAFFKGIQFDLIKELFNDSVVPTIILAKDRLMEKQLPNSGWTFEFIK